MEVRFCTSLVWWFGWRPALKPFARAAFRVESQVCHDLTVPAFQSLFQPSVPDGIKRSGRCFFLFSGFVFCNLPGNCSKELTVLAFHVKEVLSWRHSFSEEIPSSDPSPSQSKWLEIPCIPNFLVQDLSENMVLPMSLPWSSPEREWGLIISVPNYGIVSSRQAAGDILRRQGVFFRAWQWALGGREEGGPGIQSRLSQTSSYLSLVGFNTEQFAQ